MYVAINIVIIITDILQLIYGTDASSS